MAKKRLDVAAITNELQHSAFFPAAQPPEAPSSTSATQVVTTPLPRQQSEAQYSPAPLPSRQELPQPDAALLPQPLERAEIAGNRPANSPQEESQPARNHASNNASSDASFHASTLARDQERMTQHTSVPTRAYTDMPPAEAPAVPGAAPEADEIEAIRKRVRQIGKEVSFVRLTLEEKRQLADIAYTYKSQGLKTSENEISRIGINWLLDDYRAHGPESVLARVIAALNA